MLYVLWFIIVIWCNGKLLSVFSIGVALDSDWVNIERSALVSEINNLSRTLIWCLLCVISSPHLQRDWLFKAFSFFFRSQGRVICFEAFFDGISKERIFLGSYSLHFIFILPLRITFLIKYINNFWMYNCHSIRSLNTKREICCLKLNKNVKRDDSIKSQIIIKLTAENQKKKTQSSKS